MSHGDSSHGAQGGAFFPVEKWTLSLQEDQVMARVIGCAIAVHRELGPGFLESIYRRAMALELDAAGLKFKQELPVRVTYRGVEIPGQRVDLIVERLVVVELKSVMHVDRVHLAQVISYLKTREPALYKRLRQQATSNSSSVHKRPRHR